MTHYDHALTIFGLRGRDPAYATVQHCNMLRASCDALMVGAALIEFFALVRIDAAKAAGR